MNLLLYFYNKIHNLDSSNEYENEKLYIKDQFVWRMQRYEELEQIFKSKIYG